MTSMQDTLTWMNIENGSLISSGMRQHITRLSATHLSAKTRMNMLNSLLSSANAASNPYERAEVQAICGADFYQMIALDAARKWIEEARAFFESAQDKHRQAVTSWMLYLILRSRGQARLAFHLGQKARDLFLEKEKQYAMLNHAELRKWYEQTALDLTRDMINVPENLLEWCYAFRGSQLSISAIEMRERLWQSVELGNFASADREAEALVETTRNATEVEECAEALAIRGTAEWMLERRMNAVYYFREALAYFLPNTHAYAMTTWMLGLAQYSFPNLRTVGVTSLQRAIDLTDQLRIQSVRQNARDKRDWYALLLTAMKCELKKWIANQP